MGERGGDKGITILTVNDSASVGSLRVSADQVLRRTPNGDDVVARPDAMSYAAALACAQRLAGYRADGMNTSKRTGWQDLIGIGDVRLLCAGKVLECQEPPRSASGPDRDRGWGCAGRAGYQRGGRERNGATRALHRRNRFRQV